MRIKETKQETYEFKRDVILGECVQPSLHAWALRWQRLQTVFRSLPASRGADSLGSGAAVLQHCCLCVTWAMTSSQKVVSCSKLLACVCVACLDRC